MQLKAAALKLIALKASPVKETPPRRLQRQPCNKKRLESSALTPSVQCKLPSFFIKALRLTAKQQASLPI